MTQYPSMGKFQRETSLTKKLCPKGGEVACFFPQFSVSLHLTVLCDLPYVAVIYIHSAYIQILGRKINFQNKIHLHDLETTVVKEKDHSLF